MHQGCFLGTFVKFSIKAFSETNSVWPPRRFSKRYFNHYFYYFQADCMDNQTVHHQCGMENGCIGSMEDWVCVCEAFGWIAHEIDLMQCHKRERLAYTIQKMKFSLNPQFPADLVTFTEEIFNGKLHFLCSVMSILLLIFSFSAPLSDLSFAMISS